MTGMAGIRVLQLNSALGEMVLDVRGSSPCMPVSLCIENKCLGVLSQLGIQILLAFRSPLALWTEITLELLT